MEQGNGIIENAFAAARKNAAEKRGINMTLSDEEIDKQLGDIYEKEFDAEYNKEDGTPYSDEEVKKILDLCLEHNISAPSNLMRSLENELKGKGFL